MKIKDGLFLPEDFISGEKLVLKSSNELQTLEPFFALMRAKTSLR